MFRSGAKWLPNSAPTDRRREWLQSWEVRAELPEPNGKGQRRHRPSEDALVKQRRRRLKKALERPGHPEAEGERPSVATGPAGEGPGQATGPAEDDPWADALARVRGHLERARAFRAWIDERPERTAAALARQEGLTRARVSQVLKLLELAPAIVEDLERDDRRGPVPGELQLRRLAALADHDHQWERYQEDVRRCAVTVPGRSGRQDRKPRSRGFQHDLERARRYQALWDSGAYDSLEDLGRPDGITGNRVSQLMNLLHLAPEILAVLDVSEEQLPGGVRKQDVRAIARLRSHEEQVGTFRRRWPGVLGSMEAG